MTQLRIDAAGRTWTFDGSRVVTVGRGADSDVVVERPSVSRRHVELRPQGGGWQLVDVGSSAGTFVGGQRVSAVPLTGPVTVHLGDGTTGTHLVLTPLAAASPYAPPAQPYAPPAPPAPAPRIPVAPPAGAPGGVPPQPPNTPGSRPAPYGAALPPADLDVTRVPVAGGAPGFPTGPGLVVRTNTETLRFPPGRPVRIGREPGLELVAEDTAVSRQHAIIEPRPDGWWFSDRSTGGSYDEDGERITNRRIAEPTTIMLGHPTAGYEIEVVPAVDARTAQRNLARKRRRRGLLIGAAAAAVVLVVGGGVGLTAALDHGDGGGGGGGGKGDTTAAGLERAKRASVFIIAEDAGGTPMYTGSGSIISSDGLILTAGHVGQPAAPGENMDTDNPATLLVALTSANDDKPVKAAFQAEPIVTDGVLDLSVLQITADADGDPIDKADLAEKLPDPIPLGDSDELSTGDTITALGFPALGHAEASDQLSPTLSVTSGTVATFEANKDFHTDRAWIDGDIRIGSGNSGGASINDEGELIGVNDAVITANSSQGQAGEFTAGSALIRPVALAQPIIKIAKSGGDPSYTSPYLDLQQSQGASASAAGWSTTKTACSASGTQMSHLQGVRAGDTVYAEFVTHGISDGTTTGLEVVDTAGSRIATATQPWSLGSGDVCIYIPVELKSSVPSGATAYLSAGGQQLATNTVTFN